MKTILRAAALAAVAASLAACGTAGLSLPFTGHPAADAKTAQANLSAVNTNLAGFNQQVLNQIVQHCSIKGELNVAIPNPVPTGNLKVACDIKPGGLSGPPTLGLSPAAIGTPDAALASK